MKTPKNFKDQIYKFLDEPTREYFSKLILTSTGEHDVIDFKAEWIDSNKIVQIILGIANSGGGVIVFGIKENNNGTNEAVGINELKDKATITSQIEHYLPESLKFEIYDFDYRGEDYPKFKDKLFQVLLINSEKKDLPYICVKSGSTVKEGIVYVRRGTQTEPANNLEMQILISKRVDSLYSNTSEIELQEHLSQLKVLYDNIKEEYTFRQIDIFCEKMSGMMETISNSMFGEITKVKNEKYPDENFEDFILRMIKMKKKKIEKVLDLK